MAGESAAKVAKRLREKAERQLKAAECWEKGAEGERETAVALSALPPDVWTVLHDVRWPGRSRANIDHVVVGPGGVFIVDSKNWSGRIEVRDGELRQNGRRREAAVAGAAEAALALTPVVARVSGLAVVPVLCFATEERHAAWARDVMVCSTANVAHMLSSRLTVLNPAQVQAVALAVDASLRGAGPAPAPAPRRTTRRAARGATAHPAPATPPTPPREPQPSAHRARRPSRTPRSKKGTGPLPFLVVALLVFGAIGFPSVRDGITGAVSDFIVTTATSDDEPATTPGGPAGDQQTKRDRRRQRAQQEGS